MSSAGTGAHVLMLTENADQHIAKQAASLTCAGYCVSTLAPVAAQYPAPRSGPAGQGQQIFHMADDLLRRGEALPEGALLADLLGAPIAERLEEVTALERIRRDMRWIFRARRLAAAMHWSGRQRRTRIRAFRARRQQANVALLPPDCSSRLSLTARYAARALKFCDNASDWQARIAELGPPRVVHAHDIFTLVAGVVLADRYGAKLVYDAHEYEPQRTPVLSPDECGIIELLEDRTLAGAAGIQTVSESIAGLYRQRFPHLHINLAMNCPALGAASGEVPGLRASLGLGPDVPLAVFVGLPELEGRGLGIVLQAMGHLPELHLAVIGPRWKQQDAELVAAVRDAGLEMRVHLLDPVAPGDVILAIRDADFSVCLMQDTSLNHRFALPNKLFESLLAGVPVLVADLPDMGGLVRRLGAGLVVDQTDVEAVVRAMRQVLANREAYVPTGQGRAAVEAACSWEGQEAALLAFYESVLAGAPASAARDGI